MNMFNKPKLLKKDKIVKDKVYPEPITEGYLTLSISIYDIPEYISFYSSNQEQSFDIDYICTDEKVVKHKINDYVFHLGKHSERVIHVIGNDNFQDLKLNIDYYINKLLGYTKDEDIHEFKFKAFKNLTQHYL